MAIRIYGASDDLVEIEETDDVGMSREATMWADEVPPGRPILVGMPEAGVVVVMRYAPKGAGATWQASIRQIDEGILIPWPVKVENAPPDGHPDPQSYSVLVTIACPLGTPIRCGKKTLRA